MSSPATRVFQMLSGVWMCASQVGVGPEKRSALAEVCVVNFDGDVVYHRYVKPQEKVTGTSERLSPTARFIVCSILCVLSAVICRTLLPPP